MVAVTGGATASVRINAPIFETAPALPRPDVMKRYRDMFVTSQPLPRINPYVYSPSVLAPTWLEKIHGAIRSSIAPTSAFVPGNGQWLTQQVANAASDFFSTTADLLPSEPYLYSSRTGDLVAEFDAAHGKLTSIVSPDFVLLFAVVDGAPVERRVTDACSLREEVRRITSKLTTGAHGEVDAGE